MKNKKLLFLAPIFYILSIVIFTLLVQLIIGYNTKGHNELYDLIYTVAFFMSKPVYTIIYFIIFLFPLWLLIYSSIKKRKSLIIGSILCTIISIILYALIFIVN